MSLPRIISLYAPCQGSGKSTVASVLERTYGYTLLKLATPIKAMTKALLDSLFDIPEYGISDVTRYVEGDCKEVQLPVLDVTARRLLQTLGTEWGQTVMGKPIWTRILLAKAGAILAKGGNVVVDDMRFPHEYDLLAKAGSVFIKVERPGVYDTTGHSSEGRLNDFTFQQTILNDGTLHQLRDQALVALTRLDKETCRLSAI